MQSNGFIYSDELNDALTFLVESGDVKVTRKLDNIEIDTGHSCKVTAKTTSMEFVAEMYNDKALLNISSSGPIPFIEAHIFEGRINKNKYYIIDK